MTTTLNSIDKTLPNILLYYSVLNCKILFLKILHYHIIYFNQSWECTNQCLGMYVTIQKLIIHRQKSN